jgi:homocysteine S-methyltransferase
MLADEAERYHAHQIGLLASCGIDMISALTMTSVPEAIGIVRAAERQGLPAVISFTLETDGRLPTGDSLQGAIEAVDAATAVRPAYYMINCVHPSHFEAVLAEGGDWIRRIRGLRANASRRSHAELDEAIELDCGDPIELGAEYRRLTASLPRLTIFGGCCGTDERHVSAIARAVSPG